MAVIKCFAELLAQYQIAPESKPHLAQMMRYAFQQVNQDLMEEMVQAEKQLRDIEAKIDGM